MLLTLSCLQMFLGFPLGISLENPHDFIGIFFPPGPLFRILAPTLGIQVSAEFLLPVSKHGVNSEQMKTWHRPGEMEQDVLGSLLLLSLGEGTVSCLAPLAFLCWTSMDSSRWQG